MFILRDLIPQLQAEFSDTPLERKRSVWFAYTLLAVVVPFTSSSITSNLLRSLRTLFGLELKLQRFYGFMASPTLPWNKLWRRMWDLIPYPTTEDRLLLVLEDFIKIDRIFENLSVKIMWLHTVLSGRIFVGTKVICCSYRPWVGQEIIESDARNSGSHIDCRATCLQTKIISCYIHE